MEWPVVAKCLSIIKFAISIQSPQALWPAVGRQERLWGTGILLLQDFRGKTMQAIKGKPINNASRYRATNQKIKFRKLRQIKTNRGKISF